MEAEKVVVMNGGDGESSYAHNSSAQKGVILKSQQFVEETLKDYGNKGFPECFNLAELGCSSGPNTLLVVTNIVHNVYAISREKNLKSPEIQIFLNDLPDNDFNTIFKMLPPFYSKLNSNHHKYGDSCFISGVPGSFYTRLFPSRSLHFVHSSYSLHWLCQVPERLENNKGNIHISKSSPRGVYEAYLNQYKKDFSTFLGMRSEEVIPNGRMVLAFIGRSSADPTTIDCSRPWEIVANSLQDLSAEGLVDEGDITSFNVPFYNPCIEEVKGIVENEGSFSLDRLEASEIIWKDELKSNASDKESSIEKLMLNSTRAVLEPMLSVHFGINSMDKLFERYSMHMAEHLVTETVKVFNNDFLYKEIRSLNSHISSSSSS